MIPTKEILHTIFIIVTSGWTLSIALNFLGYAANWQYGNKSKWGPFLWIVISVVWTAYFIYTGQLFLCFGPVGNVLTQIRNLRKYVLDEGTDGGKKICSLSCVSKEMNK